MSKKLLPILYETNVIIMHQAQKFERFLRGLQSTHLIGRHIVCFALRHVMKTVNMLTERKFIEEKLRTLSSAASTFSC